MELKFRKRDILNAPQGYYLAHAVSADLSLGAGVAKQLDRVYNLKDKLVRWHSNPNVGDCLTVDNVFNLVDKKSRYDKVDIDGLRTCFESMRNTAVALGVKKIAMPKIGCGCDDLDWEDVKEILIRTFWNLDIDFLVCVLSDEDEDEDMDDGEIGDYVCYLEEFCDDKPEDDNATEDDDWVEFGTDREPDEDDEADETTACIYITSEDLTAKSNDNTIIGIKTGEVDIEEVASENEDNEVFIAIDTTDCSKAEKYKFLFKTDESYVLKKCE